MKRISSKRKTLFFILIFLILFLLLGGTFAWYLLFWKKQEADRNNIEIMSPYFLYLLNPGDQKSLQFTVGNIHPGETKRVVICVSNQKPKDSAESVIDIAKNSDFSYDLEFIYTKNLALDYKIYELSRNYVYTNTSTAIPSNGIVIEGINDYYWTKKKKRTQEQSETVSELKSEDVSQNRWKEVFSAANVDSILAENKGTYLLFQEDVDENPLHLSYNKSNSENGYEYDYYLIEMSWKEDANFSDNAKETDLLYVVVNAKQPKPQLEESGGTE